MSTPGWEVPPNTQPVVPTDGENCVICHDPFTDPYETECGHVFCRRCILTWYHQTIENADDEEDPTVTCPMCRSNLYTASFVPGRIHVHFLMIPVFIRRSGLFDEGFSAAGGTFRVESNFAAREIGQAIDFLLRGNWAIEDSPCRLVPARAARDAVVMGNILREHLLHVLPQMRTQPWVARQWNYIVDTLARSLHVQWPITLSVSNELVQWLRQDLANQCAVGRPGNSMDMEQYGFWFRRLTDMTIDPHDLDSFVPSLIDYVVHNATQRHLQSWIQDVVREAATRRRRRYLNL